MKTFRLVLSCGVLGAAWPAAAQDARTSPAPAPPSASEPAPRAPLAPSVSLAAILQLAPGQRARLDRIYEGALQRRAPRERDIARWQDELRAPVSAASRSARLQRDISDTQRRIETDWLSARVQALEVLPPVQRSQLEAAARDGRFRWRPDRYFQLLLQPAASIGAPDGAVSPAALPGARSAGRGSGNVGVYAGTGYGGPQVGVYGGYGRGGVGVYGGIGRGGPSIGIGVGRVFGGRR